MKPTLPSDAEMLAHIEAFCARLSVKDTTFGRRAVGDPNLIANLRAGRSLTLRTANAVAEYMATNGVAEPTEKAA